MEFGFSKEQDELREVSRKFLDRHYPAERVAEIADSADGSAAGGWQQLAALGWHDPELGLVERAILAEESGYALHPVPWWPTLTLSPLAKEEPMAFVLETECRAVSIPDGWRVSGRGGPVPELGGAAALVLAAQTTDGPVLLRVPATHLTITARDSFDGLRRMAEFNCDNAVAHLVCDAAATPGTIQVLHCWSQTLLAAEGVGVARRAYDFARAHAATRTQFDRPIGTYQGVSFRIAQTYVAIELALSLTYRAAWLVGQGSDKSGVDDAVSCAVVASREAAMLACEDAIQVLGGIGMTWEHPIHRWYRRALWLDAFGAGSAEHRQRLAAALLS